MPDQSSRANRLDRAIADLLAQAPEVEAAAVVSFDGLPMASALPATMDEDRVAAMSAALLSLGERAAEGLGRGALSQVYIEGEHGTVFLVSADDEAVLVAVAAKGAKVGMMLYEVRRAAATVADVLRTEVVEAVEASTEAASFVAPVAAPAAAPVEAVYTPEPAYAPETAYTPEPAYAPETAYTPEPAYTPAQTYVDPLQSPVSEPVSSYAPASSDPTWPSYLPNGSATAATEPPTWS